MFITKRHIDRRTFLRGSGVMLSLPLLDSMLPAQTPLAQTVAAPTAARTRFLGLFFAHGFARLLDETGFWIPDKTGRDFEMPMILEPLTPFRDQTLIFSGWDCAAAMALPGSNG